MKKFRMVCWLVALSLLLGGCGAPAAEPTPVPSEAVSTPVPTPVVQGELADQVRQMLAPYEAALNQAAKDSGDSIAYTIPGDLLLQMAQDAADLGQSAVGGRYRFSWRSQVESTYVATMDDAQAEMDILLPSVTPDPKNEAPIDSQQFGDYAVAGGGLFDRTRSYDVAEKLTSGSAEFTELLNGVLTGHELFSFAVRGSDLYFVDASLDVAADLDELTIQDGYLVAVGVLRSDGLDIVEYHVDSGDVLPQPATLNLNQLISSITPDSRVSVTVRPAQNAQ